MTMTASRPLATEAARNRDPATTRRRERFGVRSMMAPFFILFVVVFLLPLGTCPVAQPVGADEPGLVRARADGLRRAAQLRPAVLGDRRSRALGNVALYCLIYIPLMVLRARNALLLDSGMAAERFSQLLLFLPHACR